MITDKKYDPTWNGFWPQGCLDELKKRIDDHFSEHIANNGTILKKTEKEENHESNVIQTIE